MSIPYPQPERHPKPTKNRPEPCQNFSTLTFLAQEIALAFKSQPDFDEARKSIWRAATNYAEKTACNTIDTRWQYAGENDLTKWRGVFFIITGLRFPDKKGYTWA